jgi:hypothetical protein
VIRGSADREYMGMTREDSIAAAATVALVMALVALIFYA